jgi:hypothetical protein
VNKKTQQDLVATRDVFIAAQYLINQRRSHFVSKKQLHCVFGLFFRALEQLDGSGGNT